MRSLRLFVLVRLAIVASTGAARADEIFVTNNDVGPTLSTRLRLHHLGGYGEPALISGLHLPNGIAVSGSNRFVTNNGEAGPVGGTGTIGEYTTSGATVNPTLVSGLSFPSGIAVVPTVPEPIAASHLHSSDSFLRNSDPDGAKRAKETTRLPRRDAAKARRPQKSVAAQPQAVSPRADDDPWTYCRYIG